MSDVVALPTPTSPNQRQPVATQSCRCGCGRTEIAGLDVELAQLLIVRLLVKEVEAVAHRNPALAEDLLFGGRRALWGLEGFCHQDWKDVPVQLGVPTPSWVEAWRKRVKESGILVTPKKTKSGRRR